MDRYIFLDIDGVLNDHISHANGYSGIKKECVDNLNAIIDAVPDVKIVISSAWRYMVLRKSMTILGFEHMLLICGVNCEGRIHGYTISDEDVDVSDEQLEQCKNLYEVGLVERVNEIRQHMSLCEKDSMFVVLDDLPLDMPELIRVDCNTGMTSDDAAVAIEMLGGYQFHGRAEFTLTRDPTITFPTPTN